MSSRERAVSVLVAAAGAAWEASALRLLDGGASVVLKRCVDLADLLGSATTGQAEVAVVSGDLSGLDADAVVSLLREEVRCVAVGGDGLALSRIGVVEAVPEAQLGLLPEAVGRAAAGELVLDPGPVVGSDLPQAAARGRVIAVHGPAGAPGRTTLAVGLAAESARRGRPCLLIDADPYGGAVAQHLGVLDEVSGLLSAARLVNAGTLDAASFARCRRVVSNDLEVVTGLPRPDRWVEVRPGVLDAVLDRSREVGDVVLDTGFSLEEDTDLGRAVSRNQLTLDAIAGADHVVVVGSAEPTGLARLARTLVELRDGTEVPVTVVINRMRDSLGWSRRDLLGMVEGYLRAHAVHFVPEDRSAIDKALVTGRSVTELGDSPLRRALSDLSDTVLDRRLPQPPPISR